MQAWVGEGVLIVAVGEIKQDTNNDRIWPNLKVTERQQNIENKECKAEKTKGK